MRAFGLHGADLEIDATGSRAAGDLVASAKNLHMYGLHRTAQHIARSVRASNDSLAVAPGTDALFFDIAWRTNDWDLPVSDAAKATSSGSFYSALRAVHRERDQAAAQVAVEGALKAEMTRLKELGWERMAEIGKSVDNLLCLREVASWYSAPVQQALAEGDMDNVALQRFTAIRSDLRSVCIVRTTMQC